MRGSEIDKASDLDSRTTLIRADSAPSDSGRRTSSWTLPPDLLSEAVGRLRSSALLYALWLTRK
jgi:hypothetical protein